MRKCLYNSWLLGMITFTFNKDYIFAVGKNKFTLFLFFA